MYVCLHGGVFEGFFGGPGFVFEIEGGTPFLALGSQEATKWAFDRFLIDLGSTKWAKMVPRCPKMGGHLGHLASHLGHLGP